MINSHCNTIKLRWQAIYWISHSSQEACLLSKRERSLLIWAGNLNLALSKLLITLLYCITNFFSQWCPTSCGQRGANSGRGNHKKKMRMSFFCNPYLFKLLHIQVVIMSVPCPSVSTLSKLWTYINSMNVYWCSDNFHDFTTKHVLIGDITYWEQLYVLSVILALGFTEMWTASKSTLFTGSSRFWRN